jgi:hypothetical protein
MPNEIYNFLKENKLTTKDEQSFLVEYSNPEKAQELYSFFKQNNLTQKDSASFYDTYLKKKELTEVSTTGAEATTVPVEQEQEPTEKTTPSTSDWKETLKKEPTLDFEKTPTQTKLLTKQIEGSNLPTESQLPYEEVFDVEAESRKKISDGYIRMREQKGWTGKPQSQWSGKDRLLVREYNNTLNELTSLTQEDNVGNYLDIIKTDYQKGLTALDDLKKDKTVNTIVKGKIEKALRLREDLNSKGVYYGRDLEFIQDDPLADYTESEQNQLRFLERVGNGSLLGKIIQLQMPKDIQQKEQQESIDIDKYYTPEKWEEYAATGLSFAMDSPLFMALGGAGGGVAKVATGGIYKSAINGMTKEMMRLGVKRELAQGIAANAFSKTIKGKLTELATSGIAGTGMLGGYDGLNNVADQYLEAHAKGEDLENFAWKEFLGESGKGALLGFSMGVVSPLFSKAEGVIDRVVSNEIAKGAAKGGIKGLGFGTEATLFATIPAALEGRIPTTDELVESGIMLGVIKMSNMPSSMVGKVNVSKGNKNNYKDIEYSQRELDQLGLKDGSPKEIRDQVFSLSNDKIKEIASDKNIPLLTKYKILMNQGGVAPVGNLALDDVTVKKEGEEFVVQTFVKDKKGNAELVSEHKFDNEVDANEVVRTSKQAIYEEKVRGFVYNADVQTKTEIQGKLEELKNDEKQRILEAWDTPLQLRSPEQISDVNKLLGILNESTGGVTGTNAFNNKFDVKQEGTPKEEVKQPTEVKTTPEVTTEVNDTQKGIKAEETKEIIPEEVQVAENKELITAKDETIKEPLVSEQGKTDIKQEGKEEFPSAPDVSKLLEEASNTGGEYLDFSVYKPIYRALTDTKFRETSKQEAINDAKKQISNIHKGIYDKNVGSYADQLSRAKEHLERMENTPITDDLFYNFQTNEQISKEYNKAKQDGSNPELVKEVDKLLGETKLKEETISPKEEVKQEEINNGENKTGDKERSLAFSASLDEISQSFDVPDLSKEIQKQKQAAASQKIVDFVNENTEGLSNVNSKIKDHLIKEASKVTPQNKKWKIKHMKRIIENSEYAKKVEDAITEQGKIKDKKIWNRIKNDIDSHTWVEKDVKLAKSLTRNGSRFKSWLNEVDLSSLSNVDGTDFVQLYTEALIGLQRKGTPDFSKLKEFEQKYKSVVDETIDNNLANPEYKDTELFREKYAIDEVQGREVDKMLNRADKINAALERYNNGEQFSATDVKNLKREASSLRKLIKSYVDKGLISEKDAQLISSDPRFQALTDIANESKETLENISKEVKAIELKQKNDALNETKTLLTDKLISESKYAEDGIMLNSIKSSLKDISKYPNALEYLSSYDAEYLRDALVEISKNDIVPTNIYELNEKLIRAVKTAKIETETIEGLRNVRETNKRVKEFTDKSANTLQKYLDISPSWKIGEIFEMVNMVGKATNNPIYNDILQGTEASIIKAHTLHSREIKEVYDLAKKMHKPKTKFGQAYDVVVGNQNMTKDAKVSSCRIGILMPQVRFSQIVKEGKTVVYDGNRYYVENLKGEKITEGEAYVRFGTLEEAKQWAEKNIAKVIGEDNYDLYFQLNKGKYSIERKDAKFDKNKQANDKELDAFDIAYNSLTNNGTEKLLVSSDAEALAKLSKEEQVLYKRLRQGYQKFEGDASATAAAEGQSLILEHESYYPFQVKSRGKGDIDASELINSIKTSNEKGGLPEVTGSIYKKTNAIKYIDFDAVRVYDKYVNDLMVSRHVLPEARTQIAALENLSKKFRNEFKETGSDEWRVDFIKAVKDDYLFRMKTNYEQRVFGGSAKVGFTIPKLGDKYIDVANMYRAITQYSIHNAMQRWDRVPRDIIPNSAQFRISPFRIMFNKRSTEPEWVYFTEDNPDTILALSAEEYANKTSMGTGNEKMPFNKGKLQQWADLHIKIGDSWSAREGYIKYFTQEYKAREGQEFDAKKYSTDADYRETIKNSDNFKEAKAAAQWRVSRVATPQIAFGAKMYPSFVLSSFETMQRNKLGGQLNSPLTQYSQNQAARWWQNWRNVINNTNEGRLEATKQLGNQIIGEFTYNMMAQGSLALTKYALATLSDKDDLEAYFGDNMRDVYTNPNTYIASALNSALSLSIGGYGNIGRLMFNALYSGIFDIPATTELKAESYRIKKLKQEWSPMFRGSLNASFDITSNYGKKADTWGMIIPVYGASTIKLVEKAGQGLSELYNAKVKFIDKEISGEDFNAWHFSNAVANIAALKVQYPAMASVNQIMETLGKEKQIKPMSYKALKTEMRVKYIQLVSMQADAIQKDKGSKALDEFLENKEGNYKKTWAFYNNPWNKILIDYVGEINDMLKNEDGMSYNEKKKYWDRLYKGTELIDKKHQEILDTPIEKLDEQSFEIPLDKEADDILNELRIEMETYMGDKKAKTEVEEVLDKNKQLYYMNLMDRLNKMKLPSKQ